MKKMLFAAALVVALISLANAQDAKTLSRAITPQTLGAAKAPAESPCSPCLFYGGDWPVASSSWVAFGNGNEYDAGTVYNYTNYVPFKVPASGWNVKALFTNNIFYNYVTATNDFKLDPNTSEWVICNDMVSGVGCTTVASGTAAGNFKATGRVYEGFYFEYSVIAAVSHTGIALGRGSIGSELLETAPTAAVSNSCTTRTLSGARRITPTVLLSQNASPTRMAQRAASTS